MCSGSENYDMFFVINENDAGKNLDFVNGAVTARSVVALVLTLAHGCYVTTLQGHELVSMAPEKRPVAQFKE